MVAEIPPTERSYGEKTPSTARLLYGRRGPGAGLRSSQLSGPYGHEDHVPDGATGRGVPTPPPWRPLWRPDVYAAAGPSDPALRRDQAVGQQVHGGPRGCLVVARRTEEVLCVHTGSLAQPFRVSELQRSFLVASLSMGVQEARLSVSRRASA